MPRKTAPAPKGRKPSAPAPEIRSSLPYLQELKGRLEVAQFLCEIGIEADLPQQDEIYRFVLKGLDAAREVPA